MGKGIVLIDFSHHKLWSLALDIISVVMEKSKVLFLVGSLSVGSIFMVNYTLVVKGNHQHDLHSQFL